MKFNQAGQVGKLVATDISGTDIKNLGAFGLLVQSDSQAAIKSSANRDSRNFFEPFGLDRSPINSGGISWAISTAW